MRVDRRFSSTTNTKSIFDIFFVIWSINIFDKKVIHKFQTVVNDSDSNDDDIESVSSDSPSPTPEREKPPNSEYLNSESEDEEDVVSTENVKYKDDVSIPFARDILSQHPIPAQCLLDFSDLKIDDNDNYLNTQFSRSSVGGSKYLMNVHPNPLEINDLVFESRFESGNLAKAVKITPVYYELYLRYDMYTNRHSQWFYFRVTNTRKGAPYRWVVRKLIRNFRFN